MSAVLGTREDSAPKSPPRETSKDANGSDVVGLIDGRAEDDDGGGPRSGAAVGGPRCGAMDESGAGADADADARSTDGTDGSTGGGERGGRTGVSNSVPRSVGRPGGRPGVRFAGWSTITKPSDFSDCSDCSESGVDGRRFTDGRGTGSGSDASGGAAGRTKDPSAPRRGLRAGAGDAFSAKDEADAEAEARATDGGSRKLGVGESPWRRESRGSTRIACPPDVAIAIPAPLAPLAIEAEDEIPAGESKTSEGRTRPAVTSALVGVKSATRPGDAAGENRACAGAGSGGEGEIGGAARWNAGVRAWRAGDGTDEDGADRVELEAAGEAAEGSAGDAPRLLPRAWANPVLDLVRVIGMGESGGTSTGAVSPGLCPSNGDRARSGSGACGVVRGVAMRAGP